MTPSSPGVDKMFTSRSSGFKWAGSGESSDAPRTETAVNEKDSLLDVNQYIMTGTERNAEGRIMMG
jgi:hypothetical protein